MKIIEVGYQRVFNLGNYESLRLESKAAVNEDEPVGDVLDQLAIETVTWKKSREARGKNGGNHELPDTSGR